MSDTDGRPSPIAAPQEAKLVMSATTNIYGAVMVSAWEMSGAIFIEMEDIQEPAGEDSSD